MSDTPAPARNRGGRPRAAAVRRDLFLRFRVTPDEAADFEARATAAGLTLSDYIRQCATNAPLRIVRRSGLDPVTLHHLALLGSNVNQIARVLNTTGETGRADRMDELASEIRIMLDMVRSGVR